MLLFLYVDHSRIAKLTPGGDRHSLYIPTDGTQSRPPTHPLGLLLSGSPLTPCIPVRLFSMGGIVAAEVEASDPSRGERGIGVYIHPLGPSRSLRPTPAGGTPNWL